MQHPVQAPELTAEQGRQFLVVLGPRHLHVDRRQRRFRPAGGLDLVVHRFQLALGAAQQNHGGAVGGQGQGHRPADTGAGAGDQNDTILKGVRRALVVGRQAVEFLDVHFDCTYFFTVFSAAAAVARRVPRNNRPARRADCRPRRCSRTRR